MVSVAISGMMSPSAAQPVVLLAPGEGIEPLQRHALSLNLFIAMHDHGQSANVNQTPVPRATMPDAASPLAAPLQPVLYFRIEFVYIPLHCAR